MKNNSEDVVAKSSVTSVSFLRWNLNPTAAALWYLATRNALHRFGIRATWTDVASEWTSNQQLQLESPFENRESTEHFQHTAFIVGIERANVARIIQKTYELRKFCNRWSLDDKNPSDTPSYSTFLIGWFPQADRESTQILGELGFDLVLHNPARLRSVLTKIVRYHTSPSSNNISSSSASQ